MNVALSSDPAPRVRPFVEGDADRWDAFVKAHPDGTFFHLSGWRRVLERALGHRTRYLVAERAGRLSGVLPLGRIRSLLFGDSLVSTPFCVYGGILADDDVTRAALAASARELAENLRVDYLELRHRERMLPDWPCKDLYVTFRKEISPDPEVNLKAIPRRQRAMIRKGISNGLVGEVDPNPERLYRIYSESVRNLGTPVFPKRLFRTLREEFGDACEMLTVSSGDAAVASVMSFYFRDEVLPYYGGGLAAARDLAANDFLYWDLMRRAAERGVRIYDYGRSKREVGSYRFKKHWGFEPQPLYYECHLVKARAIPEVNPLNPKYRLMVETWKKLPLWLSRIVGPPIARNLG